MAKKQSSKKTVVKKAGGLSVFWNKHWQVILIAVLVVGILGFLGVNRLIIYNQKQQFDQAEKSLDTLYANIVKDVGQPTSMTKDKSCSYASTEGGRGGLRCYISIRLFYKVQAGLDTATRYAKITDQTITNNSSSIFADSEFKSPAPEVSNGDYYSLKSSLSDSRGGLNCDVAYYSALNLSTTILNNEYFKIPNNINFITSLSCYGDSLAEFYPVKN